MEEGGMCFFFSAFLCGERHETRQRGKREEMRRVEWGGAGGVILKCNTIILLSIGKIVK